MSADPTQTGGPARISPILIVLIVTAVFALIVVAALAFISGQQEMPGDAVDTGAAIVDSSAYSTGVTEVEPRPITDFSLVTENGPLTLESMRGDFVLIYFGYTYCPDFCPSTLTDWRVIKRALGDEAEGITFLLVSVDPSRDTPEVLAAYTSRFDSDIVGGTASEAALSALVEEFGAFFEVVDAGDAPYYMVNHTTSQFLIDPKGELVAVYAFGTPVDIITADLQARLVR